MTLQDALRRDRDHFLSRIVRLRAALALAKEKLELYRAQHSGEYVGGVEYSELMQQINAALSE